MKTLRLIVASIVLILSGAMQPLQAQVSVTIGTPPPWGPAEAVGVRFYYIPDIETYFDVNTGEYIYYSNGAWVRTNTVPYPYRDFDFYEAYKVPLRDYHGDRPWENHGRYHKDYPKGYFKGHHQKTFKENPNRHKHDE